ncbi:Glycosyltransferase, GT2 family [Carnobacterium alterfunditum]|uniref:Glycosyltransferase, GT2 family n=1 Tax=Carnobacterium alterfunditum TaxID=28230 RepID=A0A1N6HJK3_9LACT|nr:glycosyltransferase [Carnobacterium alterfunditum]SIO19859.1 Glycosyltransferase, GT2 family [Carnobacterium alterfunditum]
MKIGIVILNYLNWEDTVECIQSIKTQTYDGLEIVVVDNCSNNMSIENIKKHLPNYTKIHFLQTKENLGFAKGNNVGISYCTTQLKINNVFVVNNDTIFTDELFFEKLSRIDIGNNIGAVGTEIIGSDGENQNPIEFSANFKSIIREYLFPVILFLRNIGLLKQNIKDEKKIENNENKNKNNENFILHGAAIFLTENYLNQINGFYPKTFLYYEENILGIIFKKMNLEMLYYDETSIYHKEDQSSIKSFSNQSKIKYKFGRKSVKEALKLFFAKPERIKKIVNEQKYYYDIK